MIGLDWGTSSLRAWRFAPDGQVMARRETAQGITSLPEGGFPAAFAAATGDWVADGESQALLCGMIGSRQGWLEAPYLACPAGPAEIAAAAVPLPIPGGPRAMLIPGLTCRDADGVPEVMRGEETKLVALLARVGTREATLCSPGTHAKWARVAGGCIQGFTTQMTGEVFAALSRHTILRHSLDEAPPGEGIPPGFAAGIAQAKRPGGLLHQIFGLRTRSLMGEIERRDGAGFLSGLLIGREVASVLEAGVAPPIVIAGADHLARLYAAALDAWEIPNQSAGADLAAEGLVAIGRALGMLRA
ncbi:MAG TPA: 2-dehydro-3-deoxygalactonokinase [Roseomonas sp.]|jgi:2-dehydro-3-deoxygalactonokinase